MNKIIRVGFLCVLITSLTGCFYWWRAFQTYEQLGEFDRFFSIEVQENFNVYFYKPRLLSDDIVSLAKLQPSEKLKTDSGERWRYIFRKIDQQQAIIKPEIKFYFELGISHQHKVDKIAFSALFLQIAPSEFLALSFRSLGKGEINASTRQLKVNTEMVEKITAELPLKSLVISKLGEPLKIEIKDKYEMYLYHFKLEAYKVEKGFEKRTLSMVKLFFDRETQVLAKMAGEFAGLKISIDYQNYKK